MKHLKHCGRLTTNTRKIYSQNSVSLVALLSASLTTELSNFMCNMNITISGLIRNRKV